jgi:hypothetical protein
MILILINFATSPTFYIFRRLLSIEISIFPITSAGDFIKSLLTAVLTLKPPHNNVNIQTKTHTILQKVKGVLPPITSALVILHLLLGV